ncbi:MAG: AAA family ATPase [Ginsengibacter sp.]
MSETLTIKNFGPIDKVVLELRAVNILIGDQSTGKSTMAKILSVIKEVTAFPEKNLSINGKPATNDQIMNVFLDDFRNYLEFFGIRNYLRIESFIEFTDSFVYFRYENQKIDIKTISDSTKNKKTHLAGYIPAYREAAILLKDSLFGLAALKAPLPQYFYSFGQNVSNAKKAKSLYNYTDILGIKYKYKGDDDIIIMKDGKEIAIEDASSAINSAIPLLLVFDNAVESVYPTGNRIYHNANSPYIIIEEPELNCFPTTQKKMMEHFLSKMKYETSTGFDYYCRLVITTHSPYILTSLNNLMYAYDVGQKEADEVNKIIDKKYWINPDDVSAYMLLPDGNCEDILNRDENLIAAEKIDGVSTEINEDFNSLINIEIGVKDEKY